MIVAISEVDMCSTCTGMEIIMLERPTKTIGFILPNASNYFGHTLMEAFERELSARDYRLTIALTNHHIEKEKEYLRYMAQTTDGIMIISDAEYYDMIADAVPTDLPILFLNRKPMGCPYTSVIENDYAAVFQAIFALINDGNENIACICRNPDFSTTKEILHAYQTAMENSPAGYHEEWVRFFEKSLNDVPAVVEELKEAGCTAIFTASQTLTERFLDYLVVYNKQNPGFMALAGFANNGHNTSLQKSIDMVAQPINQLVDLAVQQIIYLIEHPDTEAKDYFVKGTFRKRIYESFSSHGKD